MVNDSSKDGPVCKRCGRAISIDPLFDPEVLEGMHWLCFHLEFEHEGDPDRPCLDISCPWRRIQFYQAALSRAGIDPKAAFDAEIRAFIESHTTETGT